MGRRSRKRAGAGLAAPEPPARPAAHRPAREERPTDPPRPSPERSSAPRRAARERPQAPWHPFPLVELCVLVGVVLMVLGFVNFEDDAGRVMLVCGMAVGSLAGLDTALREHFSGFRSHSSLLAGLPAVLVAGALFFVRAPSAALVAAGALTFATAFALLRRAFRRRSGGLPFR